MNKDSCKIRIYLKIIDFIRDSNSKEFYPKVKDIVAQLEKSDIITSVRSVQRYLKDLNIEFAITIKQKEEPKVGYEIIIEDIPDFNTVYETLRLSDEAGYFKEAIAKPKESMQYISFDGKQFAGYHHIETIIRAISESRVIKFFYKKFDGEEKERKVKPYLLKEYNNRWYLVGEDADSGQDRNFGLDRIEKIEITDEKFENAEAIVAKDGFKKIIGITNPDKNKLEEVVLKIDKRYIDYFRTYPWHESAKIEQNANGEWIVNLFIRINYELKQLILINHSYVQVLRPTHLAESMKTLLTKALDKYN